MNDQKLTVYKNSYFSRPQLTSSPKIIVFDLDETLGSFFLLNILWRGLNQVRNNTTFDEQGEFNKILDLYPEFLRYGILHIIEFLYSKKKQGLIHKIYIYTNNNCTPPWVTLISNYFNYKLGINCNKNSNSEPIFDKTICAFKINNKVLEISRTTHEKTYSDFITCTMLPKCTEICFIDNTYHKNMVTEKVYYIQPRAYCHHLHPNTVLDRFYASSVGFSMKTIFDKDDSYREYLCDWFASNGVVFDTVCLDISYTTTDIFVSQKLMYHLRDFIYTNLRRKQTRKQNIRIGKTTRKNR